MLNVQPSGLGVSERSAHGTTDAISSTACTTTESLLHLEEKGISNYEETAEGNIAVQRKFIGLERDENIVTLAKSNFLLHTIEFFSKLSDIGRKNYSKLLSDIFIHCHEEPELGTLFHPVSRKFDLVMANPPYVVSGTKDTSKKIHNSKSLSLYYDGGGSGLESRFVNWIVNSLTPGGRAFIVLPKSMLARTEGNLKELILNKCTVDALVYLPAQCFYATPVETYILAITKKHNANIAQTEPVFAYLVREIGETRDTSREPIDNDLLDTVRQFRSFLADRTSFQPTSPTAKTVPISNLSAKSRWDIDFLWTTKEREDLGVVDLNLRSVENILETLKETQDNLKTTQETLNQISTTVSEWFTASLADETLFKIHRGRRVTNRSCDEHPGSVVVIASGRHKDSYFGFIDQEWLTRVFKPDGDTSNLIFTPDRKIITVGATGSVGRVHIRDEEQWFLHDDALAIEVLSDEIDLLYCRFALQSAIDEAHYGYSAKLYRERLLSLQIRVPILPNGQFDLPSQKEIASILSKKEQTEYMLKKLAETLRTTEILVPGIV